MTNPAAGFPPPPAAGYAHHPVPPNRTVPPMTTPPRTTQRPKTPKTIPPRTISTPPSPRRGALRRGEVRRIERHTAAFATTYGMAEFSVPPALLDHWIGADGFGPLISTMLANPPEPLSAAYRGHLNGRPVALLSWTAQVATTAANAAGVPVVRGDTCAFTTIAVNLVAPIAVFRSCPETVASVIHAGRVPPTMTALHMTWFASTGTDLVVHVPHRGKNPPDPLPYLQQAIALAGMYAPR